MNIPNFKENAKKFLHKPLFYMPPLLVALFLIIVPSHQEISDVKITRSNRTENVQLPYLADMAKGEVFYASFNLSVKNKKSAKLNIIPDDCIQEILINGKSFSLDGIKGLCDYSNGAFFDFSKNIYEGLNSFEVRIMNNGGPGGLQIRTSSGGFRSLSLMHYVFVLSLLLFIVLVLKKFKLKNETIIACFLAFPFVIYAFVQLILRINYELAGAYHFWDTTIYWAVGRGMVNGIAPWSGLWDIKPLGIFLLSAISYKIFDSPVFTHYFQVFILILTAATPVVAYFLQLNYRSVPKIAFAILAGLLLALYSGDRSGEVQVESMGAAFACVAIFAMAMPNFEKRKILWTALAVIGFLGACGFKEPFLFVLFGASLILCNDIKAWLYRFLLPLIIAVMLGVIILLICGWLGDFLHYIDHMSSAHIVRHGSPFQRAMDFFKLYNDMNNFSWGFAIALLAILSLPFVSFFANSKSNENALLLKVIFFGAAFFLASYSVGLGGEYWDHHYVFALPFYMALVLVLLKNWNGENSAVAKLGLASFIFLAIAVLNFPDINYEKRRMDQKNYAKESKQAAAYLDAKMNELGIDRYTFIGHHLDKSCAQIYGWTKHSPSGPYFVQTQGSHFREIPGFADSLISNINRADIVVVARMWDEIAPQANQILNEHFTERYISGCKMYFRKKR